MRFAVPPLLVAVAFGFLGPAALDGDDDDTDHLDTPSVSSDLPLDEAPADVDALP
jgi:hypothetical protein